MLKEIVNEILYVMLFVIIVTYGLFFCDLYNREALHKQAVFQASLNWNPQEGSGWIVAATHGGHPKQ